MSSDDRLTATLALLTPAVEVLRAAIGSTAEEVRVHLALHPDAGREPLDGAATPRVPRAAAHGARRRGTPPARAGAGGIDLAAIERSLTTLTALAGSVAAQLEELRRLHPQASPLPAPVPEAADPAAVADRRADRLAAWLLRQADLSDLT